MTEEDRLCLSVRQSTCRSVYLLCRLSVLMSVCLCPTFPPYSGDCWPAREKRCAGHRLDLECAASLSGRPALRLQFTGSTVCQSARLSVGGKRCHSALPALELLMYSRQTLLLMAFILGDTQTNSNPFLSLLLSLLFSFLFLTS